MKRNKIEEQIYKAVFVYYDYETDTLDVEVWMTDAIIAIVTKKQGSSPVCKIYEDDVEGARPLPNVCAFLERVAEQAISDSVEQYEFEGYDDEAPITISRNKLRWNDIRY